MAGNQQEQQREAVSSVIQIELKEFWAVGIGIMMVQPVSNSCLLVIASFV